MSCLVNRCQLSPLYLELVPTCHEFLEHIVPCTTSFDTERRLLPPPLWAIHHYLLHVKTIDTGRSLSLFFSLFAAIFVSALVTLTPERTTTTTYFHSVGPSTTYIVYLKTFNDIWHIPPVCYIIFQRHFMFSCFFISCFRTFIPFAADWWSISLWFEMRESFGSVRFPYGYIC